MAEDAPAPEDKDAKKKDDKPTPKALEWGLAVVLMAILIGILVFMISFMRSTKGLM
jgi:hypothetical protein